LDRTDDVPAPGNRDDDEGFQDREEDEAFAYSGMAEEQGSEESEEEAGQDTPGARRIGVGVWLVAVAAIVSVIVCYSLLRIASEQHYQSCVAAATGSAGNATDSLTRLVRSTAIKHCSRSPF
jgi:hypothetical protein